MGIYLIHYLINQQVYFTVDLVFWKKKGKSQKKPSFLKIIVHVGLIKKQFISFIKSASTVISLTIRYVIRLILKFRIMYFNANLSFNLQGNYKIYDSVDPYLIKDIYFLNSSYESQIKELYEEPIIYVADKANHCIRKLDVTSGISSTIAGICGQKYQHSFNQNQLYQKRGFKDGEVGVSLLNTPTDIGVDSLGVIFFDDSMNNYLRIIDIDGTVKTLLNGACRQDKRFPSLQYQTLQIIRVLCYRDWIKVSGQPSQHILTAADNMYVCPEHYTDC